MTARFADAAIAAVLPAADTFEKITENLPEGVAEVYKAANGSGIVAKVATPGYKGNVEMMIGVNSEGKIEGIQTVSHSETQGLGTKALDEAYISQFYGSDNSGVEAIVGATRTSNAVKGNVDKAQGLFGTSSVRPGNAGNAYAVG